MEKSNDIPVYYCNGVSLKMSIFDILFEFGKNIPQANDKTGEPKPEFVPEFKVFMSPQHFKAYVKILNQHLQRYEESFGNINDTPIKVKNE